MRDVNSHLKGKYDIINRYEEHKKQNYLGRGNCIRRGALVGVGANYQGAELAGAESGVSGRECYGAIRCEF